MITLIANTNHTFYLAQGRLSVDSPTLTNQIS